MYAVIGASGFLGSYIIKTLLETTDEQIIATSRSVERTRCTDRVSWRMCDVQSDDSVDRFLADIKHSRNVKIVYLAAYHNPDLVEKNKYLAWDINITSLSKFINKAFFAEKIYYSSTDSVYGNSEDNYHFKESDPCHPVNFYGHNKCAAEAIVIHAGRNVVRFPFLISPSIIQKRHFYDEIVDHLRTCRPIEMFQDSYRSSLGFDRAAELLIALMQTDHNASIVNICGDKDLSKYDVGILIAQREHFDPKYIVPVSSGQSEIWNRTKRATSTLMDNSLVKEILGLKSIDIFERAERRTV